MGNPEFVDYGRYRELGGEMDEPTFTRVTESRVTGDQFETAFREIGGLGAGLPDVNDTNVYARIREQNPDQGPMWTLAEMYLVQGRK
jgi:hypothetical protein